MLGRCALLGDNGRRGKARALVGARLAHLGSKDLTV
jgi:hypothetical protein